MHFLLFKNENNSLWSKTNTNSSTFTISFKIKFMTHSPWMYYAKNGECTSTNSRHLCSDLFLLSNIKLHQNNLVKLKRTTNKYLSNHIPAKILNNRPNIPMRVGQTRWCFCYADNNIVNITILFVIIEFVNVILCFLIYPRKHRCQPHNCNYDLSSLILSIFLFVKLVPLTIDLNTNWFYSCW